MSRNLQLRVKRQSTWYKIPIAERHASIEVSTRNLRCTGDFLAAQLEWARDRFADFRFSIGDTLQIYNYAVLGRDSYGRVDEGLAHKLAIEDGDAWLKANKDLIRELLGEKDYTFWRWDDLLALPGVQSDLAHLTDLYNQDHLIFEMVRLDVAGYLDRRGHRIQDFSDEQLTQLDRHVLEELAVYQYQAEELDLISIYPGSNQLPLRPKNLQLLALPEGLKNRHYITLDIKDLENDGPITRPDGAEQLVSVS